MSSVPKIKLNTGALIPAVGLGGWGGTTAEGRAAATTWMLSALKAGYRHIDTAHGYGTEKATGKAIKQSGIPREEIFVTTKLPWNHPGQVERSIQESLNNSGLDYFDLYLLHFPQHLVYEGDEPVYNEDGSHKVTYEPPISETWADMEKILASGRVKAIGVSNFSIKTLEPLLKTAKIIPAVNQIELHPYLAQTELVKYCQNKGIAITAYTPTGYSIVRGDPKIIELAAKYKVSPAQIILAWHISRGVIVVPKSSNEERQKENINLPTLDREDLNIIDGLDRGERLCNKADKYGKVYGWTLEELGW